MFWRRLRRAIALLTTIATVVSFIYFVLFPPFPLVGFAARFVENSPESYSCHDSNSYIAVHGVWSIRIENFSHRKSIRFKKISVVPFSSEGGVAVHLGKDDSALDLPKGEMFFLPLKNIELSTSDMKIEMHDGSLPYISNHSAAFIKASKSCTLPYSWKNWQLRSRAKDRQPDTLTFNLILDNNKDIALSAAYDSELDAWIVKPHLVFKFPLIEPFSKPWFALDWH